MLFLSSVNSRKEGLITDLTQESNDCCLCVFVSYRYNASVNFTEGRCPGSKAIVFDKVGSFVMVPNVNIGDCDYTIAFWIRLLRHDDRVVIGSGSSRSGKSFSLVIDGYHSNFEFRYEAFTRKLFETTCVFGFPDVVRNNWIHIAVTCEQENRVKIFFNGEIVNSFKRQYYVSVLLPKDKPPKETFVIGHDYFLSPVIMDLHILGFALSGDEIYDLYRG